MKIFITERQLNELKEVLLEKSFYVDTKKVLIVKNFLDKNFSRGTMDSISDKGYPQKTKVIGMKDGNGETIKNMTFSQMIDLLEDKFHYIYTNRTQREKFLKQVLNDWYNKKISNEGLLSLNVL